MTENTDWNTVSQSLDSLFEKTVPLRRSFSPVQQERIKTQGEIYRQAHQLFVEKRENLYQWQKLESARKTWNHLYDLEAKERYEQALLDYRKACSALPEWLAYYEAMKNLNSV